MFSLQKKNINYLRLKENLLNSYVHNKELKKIKKMRLKKDRVQLYWTGYRQQSIHRRYPTTAQHGNFGLLCFHPGPVRSSLVNLDTPGLPRVAHIDAELSADARST